MRDANGLLVGVVVGDLDIGGLNGLQVVRVVRKLNSTVASFLVNRAGIPDQSGVFNYESNDCSGPALVQVEAGSWTAEAIVSGDTAYYPSSEPSPHHIRSYRGANCMQPLCCSGNADIPGSLVAPAEAFDLATLGLVPPFLFEGP